jgi:hypothetical protein
MNFQVKLFSWADQGNHLIVLGRGCMDKGSFTKLFDEIETTTRRLTQCKVLVDLSDSTYTIDSLEIEGLVAELPLDRWAPANRIAFVAAPGSLDYHRLDFLRTGLVRHGLTAAVFHNSKFAIDWLADIV